MDVEYNAIPEGETRIVYVRPIAVADLPADVQAQIGELKTVYAVHDVDGARLALVADRIMAFELARQHDLAPENAH